MCRPAAQANERHEPRKLQLATHRSDEMEEITECSFKRSKLRLTKGAGLHSAKLTQLVGAELRLGTDRLLITHHDRFGLKSAES